MKSNVALLTLAALLSSSLASPVLPHLYNSPTWSVTNYIDGCSPGGCVYSFNISTNGSGTGEFSEPAFITFCTGIDDRVEAECNDPSVVTNEVGGLNNVTLVVQHMWKNTLDDGSVGTFKIMGNFTVVFDAPLPRSFDVPQLAETVIA